MSRLLSFFTLILLVLTLSNCTQKVAPYIYTIYDEPAQNSSTGIERHLKEAASFRDPLEGAADIRDAIKVQDFMLRYLIIDGSDVLLSKVMDDYNEAQSDLYHSAAVNIIKRAHEGSEYANDPKTTVALKKLCVIFSPDKIDHDIIKSHGCQSIYTDIFKKTFSVYKKELDVYNNR